MSNHSVLNNHFEYTWPCYTDEDRKYILQMLKKNEVSFNQNSDEIYSFEKKFKQFIDIKYCLALNSGTSALHVAYLALMLKPFDEVIVPSYTFAATVMPLLHLGIKIIFVDSQKNSSCISIDDILKKITPKTKLIVISHMDGIANDMIEIMKIAREFGCYVVEDCAQAFGAMVNHRSVGTFGDIGIFSLQQKKIISAGEGGILVTNNKTIYERAVLFSYLQKRSYDEVEDLELKRFATTGLGFNFRMHPCVAALANCALLHVDEHIMKRNTIFEKLGAELLKLGFLYVPQMEVPAERRTFYTFRILLKENVSLEKKEQFIRKINEAGVPIYSSTSTPLHVQPIFTKKNAQQFFPIYSLSNEYCFDKKGIKNCNSFCKRVLRMYPYETLMDEDIISIVRIFQEKGEKLL